MKKISRALAGVIFQCLFIASSWAGGIPFPSGSSNNTSPDGKYDLVWIPPADNERHKLMLVSIPDGIKTPLLEFGRHIEVFWSPDSTHLAVTDYSGSSESEVYVFTLPSKAKVDMAKAIEESLGRVPEEFNDSHVYYKVVAWIDPKTLSFTVEGGTSPPGFEEEFNYTVDGQVKLLRKK